MNDQPPTGVTPPTQEQRRHTGWSLAGAFAAGLFVIIGWAIVVDHHARQPHPELPGETDPFARPRFLHGPWGDTFGPIGALFGAVTMWMAFRALHEQRAELDEQRKDLDAQKELLDQQLGELKAHTDALDAANGIAALRMNFDLELAIYQRLSNPRLIGKNASTYEYEVIDQALLLASATQMKKLIRTAVSTAGVTLDSRPPDDPSAE